jgi:hypothetical protein
MYQRQGDLLLLMMSVVRPRGDLRKGIAEMPREEETRTKDRLDISLLYTLHLNRS